MRTVRTLSEAWLHFSPLDHKRPAETVVIHKAGVVSFLHWDPATGEFERELHTGRRESAVMPTNPEYQFTRYAIHAGTLPSGSALATRLVEAQAYWDKRRQDDLDGTLWGANQSANIPDKVPDTTGLTPT